eukprot:TRINITY_DN54997_c0_g1_i1.p1 TRINITY_DN54997_c0_g1~~TRINITY_DN54997_c0_g1_i1.p1  ORF type:complete len:318 (+),score=69.55 TRINITY_DN54997_c0_g1_i1:124-1077(+)
MSASAAPGGVPGSPEAMVPATSPSHQEGRLTVHEANRVRKVVESNVQSIENRIRFFKREEEKIWRDLEEVRRQASTIEEGRSRALEKRLADRTIAQARERAEQQNKERAEGQRRAKAVHGAAGEAIRREKQLAGQEQRRVSQDILRQKRMQEAQARLQNFERAVAIQRASLESKLRANQEKSDRLERIRETQEAERRAAEQSVQDAESRLPDLEAEEMLCLQRLQNSRIVTQSVLEELESTLGSRNSVTSLLRAKQKEHIERFEAPVEGDEAEERGALGEQGLQGSPSSKRLAPPVTAAAAAEAAGGSRSGGYPAQR